jgi:hypothetical protein
MVLIVAAGGCSRVTRHFSGSVPTRHGVLTVNPANGPVGSTFTLVATHFLPGEGMTFEIDASKNSHFVGPRHVVGPDGKVSTTYTPQAGNPKAIYVVKAVGDRGTRATAKMTVQ